MSEKKTEMKLCPRCVLPQLHPNDVMNSLSHDGKTYVCSQCGQIESLKKLFPSRAEGMRIGQRRAQAALYGLDEHRNPKLPNVTTDDSSDTKGDKEGDK